MTCNSAAVETHAGAITSANDEGPAQSSPAGGLAAIVTWQSVNQVAKER